MTEKLHNRVINSFAFGTLGFVLMMCLMGTYYIYFLTDVIRLNAAAVGSLLLVARIIDTISVPISGAIVQKVNLPWGKYRSWLLIAPFATALFSILMFSDLNIGVGMKLVYVGFVYVMAHIFVNLAEAAQFALYPIIATNAADRVRLSCRRVQSMSFGQVLFGLIAMPMIIFFGGGNEAKGFLITIIIFVLLQVVGYLVMAKAAKPYDLRQTSDFQQTVGLKDTVLQVVTNKPLMILIVAEVCRNASLSIIFSLAVYYFKYVAQNMLAMTVFVTCLSLGSLAGALIGQPIAKTFTKKTTWGIGMMLSFVSMVAAWFFSSNTTVFIAFCTLTSIGNSIVLTLSSVLFSDVSDYAEWKTKKNAKGIVMALSSLPTKIAMTVGGGLAGFSLAIVGYEANAEPTAAMAGAISALITMLPAFLALMSVVVFQFYGLTDELIEKIHQNQSHRKVTACKAALPVK